MVIEESSCSAATAAVVDDTVVDSENENLEEEKEDEEEEGEEEGEDEGEEEGEFQLTFQGEMNPLDFTENDAFGLQPYEQLERLEYEALAERKRKALTDRQSGSAKKSRVDDSHVTTIEDIMEGMNINRRRRRSRKLKKKGRRKRSKKPLSPEVGSKLAEAVFCYAKQQHEEAIRLLKEVVLLAPNLAETYHTLGLVYEEIGDEKKAMNFYMLSAHLEPKDHPSLWKKLFALSINQGNIGQARYCLEKAIKADPKDVKLRLHLATLYVELGDCRKAAESYHEIVQLCPTDVDARQMAAKMYQKCNMLDQAILILEDYVKDHSAEADFSLVCLLVGLLMENNFHVKALRQIEHVHAVYFSQKQLPLDLTVKAGICQVHLGNLEEAEIFFRYLEMERVGDVANLIIEAANTLMNLGHYQLALKYYMMLQEYSEQVEGIVHLNIAKCYLSLMDRAKAIAFYYKGLKTMGENVDARLTLASLLVEEGKEDEAITLLSPPKHSDSTTDTCLEQSKRWWVSGKIKMLLARLYHAKGLEEEFVDAILPSVCEALSAENFNQKIRRKRKLPTSVLFERAKVLDDNQVDFMFRGFRPLAPPSEMSKGIRAKKLLQKKAAKKEAKRAAALAAGLEWKSDDSDDEYPRAPRESPLPNLLKDDEHYQLILDLCKALSSLRRYWDALRIVKDIQNLVCDTLSFERKEELRLLEVQVAYNISDPIFAFEDARSTVRQHPYSVAAWNYYYKVISRSEKKLSKPSKFLNHMKRSHPNCVPPLLISGHKLTMISQHQSAARNYLQAFKLQPDSPLINLCVGSALIGLTSGFRLQKKHQCLVQGFAFLLNNLRLTDNSQEALYNIARACHHVGLSTLAAIYYERVLVTPGTDHPVPKIAIEASAIPESPAPGSCNLRREAAYNLHLIYKKSGAVDLARQVLRNHCTL